MSLGVNTLKGMEAGHALSILTRRCAGEGIAVLETRLTGGAWGTYNHHTRVIKIDERLNTRQKAATLAHEYVHYLRGDVGPQSDAVERRVDEQAALMLISPTEYARAERIVGPDPRALAIELDTTLWVIRAWQAAQTRVTRPGRRLA